MKWVLSLALLLEASLAWAAPANHWYFVGQEKTLSSAGTLLQNAVYVGKREHLPEEKLVRVDILYVREGRPTVRHVTEKHVEGNTFTFADPSGRFTGTGELVGTEWDWRNWTYRAVFTDGTTMDGKDEVTVTGIKMEKQFFAADGTKRHQVLGDFSFVSKETYDILAAKVQ